MIIDESLVPDGYEGWVAWIDGVPIFESVPHNPKLLQLAPGMVQQLVRPEARSAMQWKRVPNQKIDRFELFYARDRIPKQPVIRFDKEPNANVRFLQMKMGGLLGNVPLRLGLNGYRVGYWAPERKHPKGGIGFCQMWEIRRDGTVIDLEPVCNPFLSRVEGGLGYAPEVAGAA